jgi:hypothetical protein
MFALTIITDIDTPIIYARVRVFMYLGMDGWKDGCTYIEAIADMLVVTLVSKCEFRNGTL